MTKLHDFEAKLVHETEKALLLDVGNEKPIWMPKSIVEDNGDGTFTVPETYALDKGII